MSRIRDKGSRVDRGRGSSRPRAVLHRRGVAAVEFALIAPLFVVIAVGMLEVSRTLLVKEALNNASYRGGLTGTSPGCDSATMIAAIQAVLVDNNIKPGDATISILVNGAAKDAKLGVKNDKISVTTSVPHSAVSWTKAYKFISGQTVHSETVVMLRSL